MDRGITRLLHYLDDFVFVAESKEAAEKKKQLLVSIWEELGIPLEPSKLEGPATCLSFLGIEVDTVALQLRLPPEKLLRLTEILETALGEESVVKKRPSEFGWPLAPRGQSSETRALLRAETPCSSLSGGGQQSTKPLHSIEHGSQSRHNMVAGIRK